jgi:hypothetical protein
MADTPHSGCGGGNPVLVRLQSRPSAAVAQMEEHRFRTPEVAGSMPVGGPTTKGLPKEALHMLLITLRSQYTRPLCAVSTSVSHHACVFSGVLARAHGARRPVEISPEQGRTGDMPGRERASGFQVTWASKLVSRVKWGDRLPNRHALFNCRSRQTARADRPIFSHQLCTLVGCSAAHPNPPWCIGCGCSRAPGGGYLDMGPPG